MIREMIHTSTTLRFPLAKSAGAVALATVLVAGGAAAGCMAAGWSDQALMAVSTAGLCLLTCVAGLFIVAQQSASNIGGGFIAAVVVRMGVTLAGLVAVRQVSGWDGVSIARWTIGWYVVTLALEVAAISRHISSLESTRTASAAVASEQPL